MPRINILIGDFHAAVTRHLRATKKSRPKPALGVADADYCGVCDDPVPVELLLVSPLLLFLL